MSQFITIETPTAHAVVGRNISVTGIDLLSAPLTIPLIYCHINSFR